MTTRIGAQAAQANYLVKRVALRQVNLCERQGDSWVTIQQGINLRAAQWLGFNARAPQVQQVFLGV